MPPGHFSNFMVQRGTIIMLGIMGADVPPIGVRPVPIPAMPIVSIFIIVPTISVSFPFTGPGDGRFSAKLLASPRDRAAAARRIERAEPRRAAAPGSPATTRGDRNPGRHPTRRRGRGLARGGT